METNFFFKSSLPFRPWLSSSGRQASWQVARPGSWQFLLLNLSFSFHDLHPCPSASSLNIRFWQNSTKSQDILGRKEKRGFEVGYEQIVE